MRGLPRLIREHQARADSLRMQVAQMRTRPLSPLKKRLREQMRLHERTVVVLTLLASRKKR